MFSPPLLEPPWTISSSYPPSLGLTPVKGVRTLACSALQPGGTWQVYTREYGSSLVPSQAGFSECISQVVIPSLVFSSPLPMSP